MSTSTGLAGRAFATLGVAVTLVATACGVEALDLDNHRCPCTTGYVCDSTRNVCVRSDVSSAAPTCTGDNCTCKTTADCKDPDFSQCGPEGKCVECVSEPKDTCAVARYCLSAHTCAPGCKSNDECAQISPTAPFCNSDRHKCVECVANTDCKKPGQQCSQAGACVDSCANGICPDGKTCCGGLCIDTTSDPNNCKLCGNVCSGAQTLCCNSTCTDPLTTKTDCGQCGIACSTTNATGTTCFGGVCRPSCLPGYGHCSTDNSGCETQVNTVAQCGSCKRNCSANVFHASGVACNGDFNCTYTGACEAPFLDCDGNKSNGCECQSTTCGAQGQPCCSSGQRCNLGSDLICNASNTCIND